MLKNKRTATVTWLKYNNFGTFLQAYALQQSILKLGYENLILNDESIPNPDISFVSLCKRIIKKILPIKRKPNDNSYCHVILETNEAYRNFRDKYLYVDEETAKNQTVSISRYDQFVCGSDQIWCPTFHKHLQGYYYADFFPHKKIAYAASFGVNQYPKEKKLEFNQLVNKFAAISCREEIGCRFVEEILNRKAPHVVDPTLLLNGKDWRKIAERPSNIPEGKYLLTYFLTPNQWYLDYARDYALKNALKLVTFYIRPTSQQEADMAISAGPSEFVSLIDHAEMFFTDSFHGSIFATHMCTPFVGFKRFTGEGAGQNHRLTDLYAKMNITERFILDATDCHRIINLPPQDFEAMHDSLKPEIQLSLDFLKESLAK